MTIPRILTGIMLLAFSVPCVAGINSFTPTGPDGGVTYDIEFTGGGALLVTTSRAIYRSTDGGANWTRTRTAENWASEPPCGESRQSQPGPVWFGRRTALRSTDGGVTWTSIAICPAAQTVCERWHHRIFRGRHRSRGWRRRTAVFFIAPAMLGATWTAIDTGLTSHLFSIAADPPNPQLLYIAVRADGSFVSSNGGSTLDTARVRTLRGKFRGFPHHGEHGARDRAPTTIASIYRRTAAPAGRRPRRSLLLAAA